MKVDGLGCPAFHFQAPTGPGRSSCVQTKNPGKSGPASGMTSSNTSCAGGRKSPGRKEELLQGEVGQDPEANDQAWNTESLRENPFR